MNSPARDLGLGISNNCIHPGYVIDGYPLTTKNIIRVLRSGGGEPIDCVKVQYVMEIEGELNKQKEQIKILMAAVENQNQYIVQLKKTLCSPYR